MEKESTPPLVSINGEMFTVIKSTRLLPGMVLKSRERNVFARLGPKEATLEEQIHTTSLRERGFPVARVLESGPHSDNDWYFIEESLGDEPFHEQFSREYQQDGHVSSETFDHYLGVLRAYVEAQFAPTNRTHVSAHGFVESAIPDEEVVGNYLACGGDVDRYHHAISAATEQLRDMPMGILQLDLNPFNVLDNGIIDFELVGYGPLGYDSLLVSLWHRWFTNDQSSHYPIAYELTIEQMEQASQLVVQAAQSAGVPNPETYIQEFLLIKTAWGFTSHRSIDNEPASKQAFYHYRAALLSHAVDHYLAGEPIDVLHFPEVRAPHDGASATQPTPHTQ